MRSRSTMQQNDKKSHVKETISLQRSEVNVVSCKPCSVVVECMAEKEVQNLLSRSGKEKKNRDGTKRRSSRKILPPTRHEGEPWRKSRKKARRRDSRERNNEEDKHEDTVVHKQLKKVKSQIFIEESSGSDSESQVSDCEKKIEEFRNYLKQEKQKISQNEDDPEKLGGRNNSFKLSPGKENSETEETSSSRNRTSSENSESKISMPKRFNLSLKKNRPSWSNNKIPGNVPRRNISFSENSDEISNNEKIQPGHWKPLLKRKMGDATDAEHSPSKLKKPDDKQGHEDGKIDKVNSNSDEARRPKCADHRGQCRRTDIEQETSLDVGNKVKNIKNLRVSLVKLEQMVNVAIQAKKDNLKPLSRYIDVTEKDRDKRPRTQDTKPRHQVENSPSKVRSTKITDYFFKIDKRTFFTDNDKKRPAKPDKDSILKEKFGICKVPVVTLVDLKKIMTPASRCLASENISDKTQKPNSVIDLNSIFTTAILPPPSSISLSNKISSSFKESTTNDVRSPTRSLHAHLDDDHTEKELPAVSQSLISHKSLWIQKILPSTSIEDSQKDSRTGTSLSRPTPEQQPLPARTNKVGDISSEITTPKSLKIVSLQSLNVTQTPRRQLDLITVDMESNETRSTATEVNQKSPTINRVEEKQVSRTQDGEDVLSDCNKSQENPADTSEMDQNLDTDADERSILVRSPIIGRHSSPRAKQKAQKRRIPVNSMTFINREILNNNSTWIGLDLPKDSANTTNTTAQDCTPRESGTPEILANDDTGIGKKKTPKKILDASSQTENVDRQSSELAHKKIIETQRSDSAPEREISASDIQLLGTISRDDSTDPKSSNEVERISSIVVEYLVSETAENVSPSRLGAKTVEPYTSGVNMLVQEKMKNVQHKDSAPEAGRSVPNTGIAAPSASSLAEDADQDRGSPRFQSDLQTDQEEGALLIDIQESDSDIPSVDTSEVSSTVGTIATSVADEAVDEERSAKKKCVLCSRTFVLVSSLGRHMKVHVEGDEKVCQICQKPIAKEDMVKHLLTHCVSVENNVPEVLVCYVCDKQFMKKCGLITHLKSKHRIKTKKGRVKLKNTSKNAKYNQCAVCLLDCKSEEDLAIHMRSHNGQELQDAYNVARAKQLDRHNCAVDEGNEASDSPEKEKTAEKEKTVSEPTKGNDTSKDCEISVCACHKEERLEISGGVIIEVSLSCMQCKTFFKTSKCFKEHYSSTSCTWSENTVVAAKLFCNKCCVILNSLGELHKHLKKHKEVDVEMKTSFLCKRCNMFYFGIGDLFYAHWFEHRNTPLYVADHRAFPNNMRVNIVEPESTEPESTDEPTQSLFIAEHQCQTCQTPFQTEVELKKHLSSSRSCSEKVVENPDLCYKLICSMCLKEYSDKSTFDNHIESHGDIRDFLHGPKGLGTSMDSSHTCSFCKTRYDAVTKYKEHLNRHKIMEEKFYCNCCQLMMDSLEDFERHIVGHKGTPEKSVACKVVFAKAKFHCEPCILRFDDQSLLDEHLATHGNATTLEPEVAGNSTPAKLYANVSVQSEDTSGKSIVIPDVIDLSDDSNSADIEIIEEVGNQQGEMVLTENNLNQEEQKTEDVQETEKPVFLRVKNLKELLPFDCKVCKAEFDTQANLDKHVCTPNISPPEASSPVVDAAKKKDFNYFCKLCNKYQSDNDADWNLHVLSHYPLLSSTKLNESWYNVSTQSNVLHHTCNFCPYNSLTLATMKHHFIRFHPNIYHPRFKCRVCKNFETESELDVKRHEFSHFRPPNATLMKLITANNNSPPLQPIENSSSQQPLSTPTTTGSPSLPQVSSMIAPPVSNSGNNSPMYQVMRQFTSPQQSGQVPPLSAPGDSVSFFQVLRNFTNSQRTMQAVPVTSSSNNLSLLQPMQNLTTPLVSGPDGSSSMFQSVQNFNNSQQVHNPPASGTANNSSTLQPTQNINNQQPSIPSPPVTSSGNRSSPFQTIENFTNRQQQVQLPPSTGSGNSPATFQPVQTFNNAQIAHAASSTNNSGALQSMRNSNKPQPPVQPPPVTSSGTNSSQLQSIQNFTNPRQSVQLTPVTSSGNSSLLQSVQQLKSTQQPRPILPLISLSDNVMPSQPADKLNNFQQPVLISSASGTANSVLAVQEIPNLNITQPPPLTSNNWSNYQQNVTVPPVVSVANNLSSFPPTDNSQWLAATAGTLQIQINNTPPYNNNVTHTVHTVPLFVANYVYCCRVCKNYKSTSEQEVKLHESIMHDVGKTAEIHRNTTEQLNVAKGQMQCIPSVSEFKCRNCHQVFESSSHLIKHMHTSHKKYPITQCNYRYQSIRQHTCQTCSTVFVNDAFLRDHIRRVHPQVKLSRSKTNDGKNLYQCDLCGLLLISEETLSYHMKSHSICNSFH